jgi:hypothetical protein
MMADKKKTMGLSKHRREKLLSWHDICFSLGGDYVER